MALVAPGASISGLAGSWGGCTVRKGRGGLVLSARRAPGRRASWPDTSPLLLFSGARRLWDELSSKNRVAWSRLEPDANRARGLFYDTVIGGLLCGSGLDVTVPVGAPPASLASLTCSGSVGGAAIDVVFSPDPTDADVGLWFDAAVFASAVSTVRLRGWRAIGGVPGPVGSPVNMWPFMDDVSGTLSVGQAVGFRVRTFSASSRRFGPALECCCVLGV
jgi:hypothetical protein